MWGAHVVFFHACALLRIFLHARGKVRVNTKKCLRSTYCSKKKLNVVTIRRYIPNDEVAWPSSYLGVDDFQNIETYAV